MEASARKSNHRLFNRNQVIVLLVAAVTILAQNMSVEARYLPTRADESDLAVLKDLIRLVSSV